MGVNHGGQGGLETPPEFGVRDANAIAPPSRFCHVSKFQGSGCAFIAFPIQQLYHLFQLEYTKTRHFK